MAMTKEQLARRKEFRETYGSQTFQVVDRLHRGWNTARVADRLNLSRGTVAAVAANYTRGTYDYFLG